MSVPKSKRSPSSMQYLETGRAIYKESMRARCIWRSAYNGFSQSARSLKYQ